MNDRSPSPPRGLAGSSPRPGRISPIRPTTVERRWAWRARAAEEARQPFPLGIAPGRPIRTLRPISGDMLRRIFDDAARPAPIASPPPSWLEIVVCTAAALAFVMFVLWLDIPR